MDTHTPRRDGALPVSRGLAEEESLLPELETPPDVAPVDRRTAIIAALAVAIAVGAGLVAQLLTALIALITNLAFYHTASLTLRSPGAAHVGAWVILIPVAGALISGLMARYGPPA